MAELIDKRTTRKTIEKYFESLAPSHYYKMDFKKASVYLDAEIAELSTTTEAEIRAKAYDRFAEKLKTELAEENWINVGYRCTFERMITEIAEQLKEE